MLPWDHKIGIAAPTFEAAQILFQVLETENVIWAAESSLYYREDLNWPYGNRCERTVYCLYPNRTLTHSTQGMVNCPVYTLTEFLACTGYEALEDQEPDIDISVLL